ncbi:MAG TPA: hydrogenase maturation nickel metallochaperone HypA, partial [Aggregatilineales bacterium]|nr:hydrogenase maturation nickel metallochaperone HypA [Aggregatilineales bacterium]
MHELSIATNLLEVALKHAQAADAQCITDLNLVIGQLSSIVDGAMLTAWEIITENTPAQGSRLHFRRVPAEFHCRDCGTRYQWLGDQFSCPSCGSDAV